MLIVGHWKQILEKESNSGFCLLISKVVLKGQRMHSKAYVMHFISVDFDADNPSC